MKTLIAASIAFTVALVSSQFAIADDKQDRIDQLIAEYELEKLSHISVLTEIDTIRLKSHKAIVIKSGRKYFLVKTRRTLRSDQYIQLERLGNSINRSDIEFCDRNIGCMTAGVSAFYSLGDKERYKQFKEDLKGDS